ncbi:hypothetical protein G4H71_14590 [Rhodococcus triatomae]|uniref:Acyl carrier protein n=1 Tax=Rhodococcus triatomae TaxID=300028 RepID=A0A1G8NFS7_9NOCA|nr:phosphopantetheine-binding protein [Rhodococcus triatomae]QNG19996.1 hypothetical protein G4H72_15785 [Rhodococcus triatomae]QNG24089.1 hypothetical protein G4H71_14590 [Rhodococcus triatomae]SDI79033.1 acyl carrier protein [Rhodococcus triatomae]
MAGDILTDLVDVVRTELAVGVVDIDAGSDLTADLGLDSVAFAIAIVAIEDRFGVRLAEEELFACRTLGDVAGLVGRQRDAVVTDA